MAEDQQRDTVPPPPGEDDAYSAETRVGPLPKDLLDSLRSFKSGPPVGERSDRPTEAERSNRPTEAERSDRPPGSERADTPQREAAISDNASAAGDPEVAFELEDGDIDEDEEMEVEPISVPAQSSKIPDLECEPESRETTFGKSIRFVPREAPQSEAAMRAEVTAGRRDVRPLFLLAVILAGFVAAYFAWSLR